MNIEVKGVNEILMMKVNPHCLFEEVLNDLNMLLDQPIFCLLYTSPSPRD